VESARPRAKKSVPVRPSVCFPSELCAVRKIALVKYKKKYGIVLQGNRLGAADRWLVLCGGTRPVIFCCCPPFDAAAAAVAYARVQLGGLESPSAYV